MDQLTKKSVLIGGALLLGLFFYYRATLCPCKARVSYKGIHLNVDLSIDSLFYPPTSNELEHIWSQWHEAKFKTDNPKFDAHSRSYMGREVYLVTHRTHIGKHFGAVILPLSFKADQSYPLLVWANGLSQQDPSVYLSNSTIMQLTKAFPSHFILVPSFRGQALVIDQKRYCSDGFFGDAFDGATDDALAFLHVVRRHYPAIDSNRIKICGVSRGGTVALLSAARDTNFSRVVSIAAPTDFLRVDSYSKYGMQFKYQFLSKTTSVKSIRNKILRSSPVHFIENSRSRILLVHGNHDRIVSVTHAKEVIDRMEKSDQFEYSINQGGHDFEDWSAIYDWLKTE